MLISSGFERKSSKKENGEVDELEESQRAGSQTTTSQRAKNKDFGVWNVHSTSKVVKLRFQSLRKSSYTAELKVAKVGINEERKEDDDEEE